MFSFKDYGNVSRPTNGSKDSDDSLNLKKMLSQSAVMTPLS